MMGVSLFPIYFFTDEAFHPLHAADLLKNGLKNSAGQWFPIYYEAAASRWTPVFAIYVHAIASPCSGCRSSSRGRRPPW